jgi:hypothetical protein
MAHESHITQDGNNLSIVLTEMSAGRTGSLELAVQTSIHEISGSKPTVTKNYLHVAFFLVIE